MFDAFDVVVPTLDRRLPGILRPVDGPSAGVLLLDGTGKRTPLVSRLFDELELYLQAIDLVTLRISISPSAHMGKRVSGVLGSVSLLRSMGVTRVLLITSALDPLATREEITASTLAGLVDLAAQGHALPEIIQIVRDLTTTIRDVADSVIGVATLLAHPTHAYAYTPALPPPTPMRKREFKAPDSAAHDAIPRVSPPALLLPLPSGNDQHETQAATAQFVTQLYSWSLALTHPERETKISHALLPGNSATRRPDDETATLVRADWFTRRRWMDAQWDHLLTELAARAPEAAARVRARVRKYREQGDGWSLRASRAAWPHLDGEARSIWLQVSSIGFVSTSTDFPPANDAESDLESSAVDTRALAHY